MKLALLQALQRRRAAGGEAVLVSALSGAWQSLCDAELTVLAGDALPVGLDAAVAAALREDRSRRLEVAGETVFVQIFQTPLRLIVVGAVHIAQPLVPMATLSGYDVVVVDPRRAFAADHRFPAVSLRHEWPDDALRALQPDRRSAVVTLTHDPKIDDPALLEALRSPAFYIGALGSRRTHAARCERLAGQGVTAAELARLHAPVGLDIGAVSPAEIAVSIMAQLTAVLRRGSGA